MGERQMSNRDKSEVCTSCDERVIFKRTIVGRYKYDESGLENVFLVNVPALECPRCGFQSVIIPNPDQLHFIIAEAVVRKPFKLSGKEVRFLRTQLGFSGFDFSKEIGFSHENLSRVENSRLEVSDELDKEIRLKYVGLRGTPKRTYKALHEALLQILHSREPGSKRITLKPTEGEWKMLSAA